MLLHHSRKLDPVVTTKTRSSPLPPPSTGGNDADTHHLWVCRRTTATLRGRPGTEGARGEGGEPRPEAGATVRGGTGRVGDGPRRRPGTRLEPKQKQALVERGRGSRLGEPDHGCPLEKRENRVPQSRAPGLLPSCGRGPPRRFPAPRCPAAATAPFRRRRPLQGPRPRPPPPPPPPAAGPAAAPRPSPGRHPPRPGPGPRPARRPRSRRPAPSPPPPPAGAPARPRRARPPLTAGRCPLLLWAQRGPAARPLRWGSALPGGTSPAPKKINHRL